MPRIPLRAVALVLLAVALGCAPDDDVPPGPRYDATGRRLEATGVPSRPPNLIVVVVDSLRHDAFAGNEDSNEGAAERKRRMPFLSELASRGVTFANTTVAAPWTLPSMLSFFTGLLPSEHGQYAVYGDWNMPEAVTTYAEVLSRGYGYQTTAFVNGPWFQSSPAALLQGFETWTADYTLQDLALLERWAGRRDRERPFYLMLHTMDAHEPYGAENHPWPPEQAGPIDPTLLEDDLARRDLFRAFTLSLDFRIHMRAARGRVLGERIQRYRWQDYPAHPDLPLASDLETAYWEGVRWTDDLLRKAVGTMEALGLLENTVLVVTADHGEAFGEHRNLGHGLWLYDEVTRVPLVAVGPGPFSGGRVVEDQVGLIDWMPTFLAYAGLDPLQDTRGRSALGLLRGEHWCRTVVSQERLDQSNTGTDMEGLRLSARNRNWKYIVTLDFKSGEAREEAYDLRADPEERHDLGRATGRLPDGFAFDDCICPTIGELRSRVWGARSVGPTIPYATTNSRVRTLRPLPCDPSD